jgi:drug/metabolite transporter (DMT)-like permease
MVQQVSSEFVSFAIYLSTTIVFLLLGIGKLKKWMLIVRQQPKLIFILNFLSMVMAILAYQSLETISPVCYLIVFCGTTSVFSTFLYKRDQFKSKWITNTLILCASLIFGAMANTHFNLGVATGLLLICITAMSFSVFLRNSELLQKKAEITAAELMALRFWLLLLVTATLSWHQISPALHKPEIWWPLVISIVGAGILPFYAVQIAVANIGHAKTAAWFPVAPTLCVGINLLLEVSAVNVAMILAAMIFLLAIVMPKIVNFYQTQTTKNTS